MKHIMVLILVGFGYMFTYSQSNNFTIGGGYVFANIKDAKTNAAGWRINGAYEIHPATGKVVHGFAISYLTVSADVEEVSGGQPIVSKYSIGTWPFYYQPKVLFGNGSLQGYGKGAFGMQFSTIKINVPGTSEFKSTDAGLYAGLGAGLSKSFSLDLSVSLEYEWAYLSNSYYNDGFLNSVNLGIGFRLN